VFWTDYYVAQISAKLPQNQATDNWNDGCGWDMNVQSRVSSQGKSSERAAGFTE
jgi:hypothetical protein